MSWVTVVLLLPPGGYVFWVHSIVCVPVYSSSSKLISMKLVLPPSGQREKCLRFGKDLNHILDNPEFSKAQLFMYF